MIRSDMPRGEFIARKLAGLALKIVIALLLGYVMYIFLTHLATKTVNDMVHALETNQAAHAATQPRR